MKYGYTDDEWERAKAEALHELQNRVKTNPQNPFITYSELTKKIKSISFNAEEYAFHAMLGEISGEEDDLGRGLISAIVVSKETGRPGKGFFDLARGRGRNGSDDEELWVNEIRLL